MEVALSQRNELSKAQNHDAVEYFCNSILPLRATILDYPISLRRNSNCVRFAALRNQLDRIAVLCDLKVTQTGPIVPPELTSSQFSSTGGIAWRLSAECFSVVISAIPTEGYSLPPGTTPPQDDLASVIAVHFEFGQDKPVACPELVGDLRRRNYNALLQHINNLLALHNVPGDKAQRFRAYLCLQVLEKDLSLLFNLLDCDSIPSEFGNSWTPSEISNLSRIINISEIGYLLPRSGGRFASLTYYISPAQQAIEKSRSQRRQEFDSNESSLKSSISSFRGVLNGFFAYVGLRATLDGQQNSLQVIPLVNLFMDNSGINTPQFANVDSMKCRPIAAEFFLLLHPPLILSIDSVEEIEQLTGIPLKSVNLSPQAPLYLLVSRYFNKEPWDSIDVHMPLPNRSQHLYHLLPTDCNNSSCVLEIAFTCSNQIPALIRILRRHAAWLSFVESFLMHPTVPFLKDDALTFKFNVSLSKMQEIVVSFPHPRGLERTVQVKIRLGDIGVNCASVSGAILSKTDKYMDPCSLDPSEILSRSHNLPVSLTWLMLRLGCSVTRTLCTLFPASEPILPSNSQPKIPQFDEGVHIFRATCLERARRNLMITDESDSNGVLSGADQISPENYKDLELLTKYISTPSIHSDIYSSIKLPGVDAVRPPTSSLTTCLEPTLRSSSILSLASRLPGVLVTTSSSQLDVKLKSTNDTNLSDNYAFSTLPGSMLVSLLDEELQPQSLQLPPPMNNSCLPPRISSYSGSPTQKYSQKSNCSEGLIQLSTAQIDKDVDSSRYRNNLPLSPLMTTAPSSVKSGNSFPNSSDSNSISSITSLVRTANQPSSLVHRDSRDISPPIKRQRKRRDLESEPIQFLSVLPTRSSFSEVNTMKQPRLTSDSNLSICKIPCSSASTSLLTAELVKSSMSQKPLSAQSHVRCLSGGGQPRSISNQSSLASNVPCIRPSLSSSSTSITSKSVYDFEDAPTSCQSSLTNSSTSFSGSTITAFRAPTTGSSLSNSLQISNSSSSYNCGQVVCETIPERKSVPKIIIKTNRPSSNISTGYPSLGTSTSLPCLGRSSVFPPNPSRSKVVVEGKPSSFLKQMLHSSPASPITTLIHRGKVTSNRSIIQHSVNLSTKYFVGKPKKERKRRTSTKIQKPHHQKHPKSSSMDVVYTSFTSPLTVTTSKRKYDATSQNFAYSLSAPNRIPQIAKPKSNRGRKKLSSLTIPATSMAIRTISEASSLSSGASLENSLLLTPTTATSNLKTSLLLKRSKSKLDKSKVDSHEESHYASSYTNVKGIGLMKGYKIPKRKFVSSQIVSSPNEVSSISKGGIATITTIDCVEGVKPIKSKSNNSPYHLPSYISPSAHTDAVPTSTCFQTRSEESIEQSFAKPSNVSTVQYPSQYTFSSAQQSQLSQNVQTKSLKKSSKNLTFIVEQLRAKSNREQVSSVSNAAGEDSYGVENSNREDFSEDHVDSTLDSSSSSLSPDESVQSGSVDNIFEKFSSSTTPTKSTLPPSNYRTTSQMQLISTSLSHDLNEVAFATDECHSDKSTSRDLSGPRDLDGASISSTTKTLISQTDTPDSPTESSSKPLVRDSSKIIPISPKSASKQGFQEKSTLSSISSNPCTSTSGPTTTSDTPRSGYHGDSWSSRFNMTRPSNSGSRFWSTSHLASHNNAERFPNVQAQVNPAAAWTIRQPAVFRGNFTQPIFRCGGAVRSATRKPRAK